MKETRSDLFEKLSKIPLYFLCSLVIISCSQGTSSLENTNSETAEPSPTSSPSPEITSLIQILKSTIDLEQSQKNMCDVLGSELKIENKRISSVLKDVVEVPEDPYKASDFISSVSYKTSSDYRIELGKRIESDILFETFKSVTEQNSISYPSPILSEFAESTFTTCGLAKEWENLRTDANSIDSKLEKLKSLATNVPWYPDGFREIQSGLAVKKSNRDLDCYSCTGLIYEVISRNGCPTSLYVQANFMDSSGTIVDWTNDTVRNLPANKKAYIELYSLSSGGRGTVQITEVNCY